MFMLNVSNPMKKLLSLFILFTLSAKAFSYHKSELVYDKFDQNQETEKSETIALNLNEMNLMVDSLFSLKFRYGRVGEIVDSLIEIELSQVALIKDSIHEQAIYYKKLSYAAFEVLKLNISYKGFKDIDHRLNMGSLSSLQRTIIFQLEKGNSKAQAKKELKIPEEAFIFIGTIFEENTKIRLPNVRIIIQDRKDPKKRFAEITGPYGTFSDTVVGYKVDSLLSFDIYLKKEGYISKSFAFDEILNEYGKVDLEEYLRKIRLTKAEVGVEIGKAANINPIYFDLDKSNIRPDAAIELNKIIGVLKEEPSLLIELSSHTDSRADDDYNMALSNQRSSSAANYIIKGGVDARRITTKGYGEKQLVNRCSNGVECTEEEHQMNRRTEFKITGMDQTAQKKTVKAEQKGKNESTSDKTKSKPEGEFVIFGTLYDKESKDVLSGGEIIIKDKNTSKKLYQGRTDFQGEFRGKINGFKKGEKVLLDITFKKKAYVSRSFSFNQILTKFDAIDLNKYVKDIELTKIGVDIEIGKAANLDIIYFEVDKAEITLEATVELDKLAAILLENRSLSIEISSHTDSRADDAYNLALSKRRAEAAETYLVKNGISYSRITAVGYGEEKLLNGCSNGVQCSEAEHAENRRTEFKIVGL